MGKPWIVGRMQEDHSRWGIYDDKSVRIASVGLIVDARPMGAAPELLESLIWAIDIIDGNISADVHKGHADYDQAIAAITKATIK